jgi:hypothetical protein
MDFFVYPITLRLLVLCRTIICGSTTECDGSGPVLFYLEICLEVLKVVNQDIPFLTRIQRGAAE